MNREKWKEDGRRGGVSLRLAHLVSLQMKRFCSAWKLRRIVRISHDSHVTFDNFTSVVT